MTILLDTGPLVALLDRRDAFHAWSTEQAGLLSSPFHTCEAVLTEAFFLVRRLSNGSGQLIELLQSNRIVCSFSYLTFDSRIHTLMQRYANVPMSFADACLVCMAEQGESSVFTLDGDFRIYRLKRNKPIPLITPGRKAR